MSEKSSRKWRTVMIVTGVIVLIIILLTGAFPTKQWSKTFGGVKDEWISSVQQTSDGGYILAGRTYSYGAGNGDAWIIKVDSKGKEQWSRTFGETSYESASSVQQTSDGGYILAGSKNSYGAENSNAWLIKTDSNGNDEWRRTFGDKSDANFVQQTLDGGYIIVGSTNSYRTGRYNPWLIKPDANGNELWNRIFEATRDGGASSAQQTLDGGYIIAGLTDSYEDGRRSAWLIKTNTSGIEQWNRTFVRDDYAEATSVSQTSDSGYILVGRSGTSNNDAWLVKSDSNGFKLWDKTFGGKYIDIASSVQQTSDGGYILAGVTWNHIIHGDSFSKAWLIKTNAEGDEQWSKTLSGSWYSSMINSVQQTSDGDYILAGSTGFLDYDGWLVKVNDESMTKEHIDW